MTKNNLLYLSPSDIELSKFSLPLTKLVTLQHKNILNNFVVLHINHALSDVYALNDLMIDYLGAKVFFITTPYNNTYYFDKKYDYLFIKRQGNYFRSYLNDKPIRLTNDASDMITVMHMAIKYGLEYIRKKYSDKNIIVLQDGGYSAAKSDLFSKHDPFNKLDKLFGMVEQTQGGSRLFKEKFKIDKASYPVLSISRSFIKMRVENHFIAQRIVEEVNRALYKLGYFLNFKSIILAGYGIIGRQLAQYLASNNTKVTILENNPGIRELAAKEGYKTIEKIGTEHFERTFCLIGVTGKCVFGLNELACFAESKSKYYFLASGSSKRNEFIELIEFFENSRSYKSDPGIHILKEISHKKVFKKKNGILEYSFEYNGVRKTIIILAEGFPINLYDNEIQSVPDRAIDPIQALLITSVIKLSQFRTQLKNGLWQISDPDIIKRIQINETDLLSEWFYLNDISAYGREPFKYFKPHPLEKTLIKL
jgi:S-adenosylhomocysteine hydrolase